MVLSVTRAPLRRRRVWIFTDHQVMDAAAKNRLALLLPSTPPGQIASLRLSNNVPGTTRPSLSTYKATNH